MAEKRSRGRLRRPSLTSPNIVDRGEGAAEEDGAFGVMKENGSDRWEDP